MELPQAFMKFSFKWNLNVLHVQSKLGKGRNISLRHLSPKYVVLVGKIYIRRMVIFDYIKYQADSITSAPEIVIKFQVECKFNKNKDKIISEHNWCSNVIALVFTGELVPLKKELNELVIFGGKFAC